MATGQWPSLVDLTTRSVYGKQQYISEYLSQSNDVYDDMPYVEGNEIGGHEFVFRTSIPAGSWRSYNMGTPYSKSTTAKARVGVGELVDYSQVDRTLAEDSGDIEKFRMNEDVAFLEGMGQTIVQTIWYGNTVSTPAEFMGFSPFYNTVSTATAQNAANVLDGGGKGSNNASVWMIGWGERTVYAIYPRGSKAGLAMEDKGDVVPGFDAYGNRFEAYTSWFRQQMGICPQDWRYCTRLANLDVTNAGLAGPNAPDLFALMAEMMLTFPTLGKQQSGVTQVDAKNDPSPGIRTVMYCNRSVRHYMDIQGMRDRNVLLRLEDYAGKVTDNFRGIPIKISDQLVVTEAQVV